MDDRLMDAERREEGETRAMERKDLEDANA
jgi:hypothetical protein